MEKINLKVLFLAILACFLWSTAVVAVKFGLNFVKPISFAGLRFILAGLLLIPFCGKLFFFIKTIKSNIKLILTLSLFQTFLAYSFFYIGMTMVSGATGAIIIGASPLSAVILAHFFMEDDKINLSKAIGVSIGIIGVIILSIKYPWNLNGLKELFGILILIFSMTFTSLGNIIVSKKKNNINPFMLNSSQMFIGGVFLLLISIPFEGIPDIKQPLGFYLSLLWLSFISAIAFSIWFLLLQMPDVKVSELNIWKFIIPVSGAILSWIILPNEYPDIISVIGMFCVGISIIISNFSKILIPFF